MATSNGLDESESDAQRDHSRAARLLRGTRYKCATGWRLLERILYLLWGKLRWLLYHRRFLWQVVMAALRSRGAKFIPSPWKEGAFFGSSVKITGRSSEANIVSFRSICDCIYGKAHWITTASGSERASGWITLATAGGTDP